jgi:hypothetical protein
MNNKQLKDRVIAHINAQLQTFVNWDGIIERLEEALEVACNERKLSDTETDGLIYIASISVMLALGEYATLQKKEIEYQYKCGSYEVKPQLTCWTNEITKVE